MSDRLNFKTKAYQHHLKSTAKMRREGEGQVGGLAAQLGWMLQLQKTPAPVS